MLVQGRKPTMCMEGTCSTTKRGEWLLKKFDKKHTCRPDYSHGGDDYNITQGFIARMIVGKVRVDPQYKVKLIQHEIMELFNIAVTYKKCWHARLDASEMLYGSWKDSYNLLPTLLYTLQTSYPCTVAELIHDGGHGCGILTTNSSESFNNMLKGCRMLPKREKDKQLFQAVHYGGQEYAVSKTSRSNPANIYSFLVDLGRKTCTCGQWSSDGIPCVHVHGLYHSFRRLADDEISSMYSVEQYMRCYNVHINPVLFPQQSVYENLRILPTVRPAEEISRSGRRQRNRFLGEMDRVARHQN
ncbi:hypothetical protein DM860_001549 [Cuscuta australis]|uniref:SWIM-type domain-containing protein n=1 Tax=Cuscuta australis TaxID=267555 RepID=A0A328ED88_9ASTE|nr:hypothetical protein DM860_001549 [Cuscuta australis]